MASNSTWQKIIIKFAIHVLTGSIIFIIIAIPAILLDYAINALEILSIDSVIILGLIIMKYAVFFMDVILFLIFIIRKSLETIKEI